MLNDKLQVIDYFIIIYYSVDFFSTKIATFLQAYKTHLLFHAKRLAFLYTSAYLVDILIAKKKTALLTSF